ncbi:unnamed protein product [Protopolystoma xenopodis]|uniref:Uncharacterized protein n=1 Tax=Protopolystoma xenopodis TaxID=117903 RepID=A0A448XC81_9PLAT|nr:unnamed protein product [Protopolystoma xenopodis]
MTTTMADDFGLVFVRFTAIVFSSFLGPLFPHHLLYSRLCLPSVCCLACLHQTDFPLSQSTFNINYRNSALDCHRTSQPANLPNQTQQYRQFQQQIEGHSANPHQLKHARVHLQHHCHTLANGHGILPDQTRIHPGLTQASYPLPGLCCMDRTISLPYCSTAFYSELGSTNSRLSGCRPVSGCQHRQVNNNRSNSFALGEPTGFRKRRKNSSFQMVGMCNSWYGGQSQVRRGLAPDRLGVWIPVPATSSVTATTEMHSRGFASSAGGSLQCLHMQTSVSPTMGKPALMSFGDPKRLSAFRLTGLQNISAPQSPLRVLRIQPTIPSLQHCLSDAPTAQSTDPECLAR